MQAAVGGIPAPAVRRDGAVARWRRVRRAVPAGLCAIVVGTAACSRADAPAPADEGAASQVPGIADAVSGAEPTASRPAAEPSAAPPSATQPPAAPRSGTLPSLSSPEHERYQQLRLEALRLMIQAAQAALPIGAFQQRIDAAARIALQDVSEAGDLQEGIVADLREAVAAADR